jgi:hypothetical protein
MLLTGHKEWPKEQMLNHLWKLPEQLSQWETMFTSCMAIITQYALLPQLLTG